MERAPPGGRAAGSGDRPPLSGYWVKRLDEIPVVPEEEPGDPIWYPLQHHFGLTAFGANVYVAAEAGDGLLGDHDETGSEQEELYLVVAGAARFTLDGEETVARAFSVVAVPDPAVRRRAVAEEPGTAVVAIGGRRAAGFDTSWQPEHFVGVPRVDE